MTHVTKKHNWIWTILIFVMFFTSSLFFFTTPVVHAQEPFTSSQELHQATEEGLGAWLSDATIGKSLALITSFFETLAGWMVNSGGVFFDVAMTYSLDSDNFKNDAVSTGWSVFRDVANMTFIFILVYIAFAAILQIGGSYQRMLITLVIVALLVNFSFFLTGLVVDAANILGSFLYNILTDNGTLGLSSQFRDGLDITSLLDPKEFAGLSNYKAAAYHMGSSVFLLIAAFVFFSAAILFTIRTVALMFILVVSPLAFVAAILDKTQTYFKSWLHKLINYSFVAPIYLLLVFMVLAVIKGGEAQKSTKELSDLTSASPFSADTLAAGLSFAGVVGYSFEDYSGIFMFYALIIGLLIAALTVSRTMADGLATMSVRYAGKALGATVGVAAFAGRQLPGRGLRALRDSKAVDKMIASNNALTRAAGRVTRGAANYGATSSFDARSGTVGKAVGATAGAAIGLAGVKTNLGRPGGKGGFESSQQASTRASEKRLRANIAAAQRSTSSEARKVGAAAAALSASKGETREQQEKAQTKAFETHLEKQQIEDYGRKFMTPSSREAADILRGKRGEYKETKEDTLAIIKQALKEDKDSE